MSSRNTFTPEDLAKRKRANIQRMLYDTFLEEYENPSSFACYVRFYKMDQKRYEENKDFTITVQFGDNLNVTQRSEAYVYDVNDLLQEGFLMPEKRICYIPVPIGKKRWDKLKRLVGDLTPYSNAEGRLDYPLTRAEISTLLANIHVQPIVCSTMEGCNPLAKISNPIYLWGTVPPQTQPVIQEWVIPPPSSNSEIDIKVKKVQEKTKKELMDILDITEDTWKRKFDIQLSSPEQVQYIGNMLKSNGVDVDNVVSFMIDKVFTSLGLIDNQ